MSDLENAVRPSLLAILGRERPMLCVTDQLALATWAWKTGAMIQRLCERRTWAVSEGEYHELYELHQPPNRSQVWIGCYRGHGRENFHVATISIPERTKDVERLRHAHFVHFGVGTIIFFVFGTSDPTLAPLGFDGDLGRRTRPIWPLTSDSAFQWPPWPVCVTDDLIHDLDAGLVQRFPAFRARS